MEMTIWTASVIDSIENNKSYNVFNVTAKVFNGLKLNTTRSSIFELIDDIEEVVALDVSLYKTNNELAVIEYPTVVGIIVDMKFSCKNRRCNKEVIKPKDASKFLKCEACKSLMRVDRLDQCTVTTINIEDSDKKYYELKVDVDVLKTIIDENCFGDDRRLSEAILVTNLAAVTYDKTTKKIESFEKIEFE